MKSRDTVSPTPSPSRHRRAAAAGIAFAAAALLCAFGAGAQTIAPPAAPASAAAGPTEFKPVVITSRKRAETLTQTPAAVSSFNAADIGERNIETLSDIGKYVPNLDINRFGVGNPAHAAIFIRGIGLQDHIITTDPGVGVYLDGIYLGRQMGANLNLANIERVEVLRGPQGTLYGKNTLGGAINIITAQPGDEEVSKVDLKLGTRGRVETGGYTNFKLNDRLSIVATGDATRRNGIGKALLVDAKDDVGEIFEYSGRVAAKLKVTNDFALIASIDGVKGINGKSPTTIDIFDPAAAASFGVTQAQLPANPDDSNSGQKALFRQTNKGTGSSVTALWNIDANLTAKVLAGYRYSSYTGGLDDDNVFADVESFPETGWARQFSIEPQLNGEYGRFDFVTGLYYGYEKGNTNSGPWVFGGPGGFFDLKQTTKSSAVYGHMGYKLRDDLKLAGGLRYSHDAKDASAQFDIWSPPDRAFRSNSWSAVTGDVSLSYDIRKALSTYVTLSTGYQSGGFPPRPFGGAATFVAFDQTKATNLETGIKGVFFDNLLQANLSVFYTRYKDLPLQVSTPVPGVGFITLTESAGVAVSKGVEFDGTLKLGREFSVQSAIGYIHSRVTEVPPTAGSIKVGDTPALTPTWTVAIAPQYRTVLASGSAVDARIDYSYRGKMFGQSANNDNNRIKSRSLVGFNIAYTPAAAKWTAALYGQNIFNKAYDVGRLDGDGPGFTGVIRSNDRSEFGVKLGYTF
ncbi:MAG TPA: TonB-dependent receptor [Burkholderiaceae bacterium]|nr:TonB-dependent receptor [Burkholderiaceae bacterium]